MVKNPQIDNDKINLIELIIKIWEGRWKIAVAVVISFIAMKSYQFTQPNNFSARTEIKPISVSVNNKYSIFNNTIGLTQNNLNFEKITKSDLFKLYIEILNDKSIFEDAMHKLNLLDASQYSDEQKYNEAIVKLASSVKILSPKIDKKKRGGIEISHYSINFIHDDKEKWKNTLIYVDELANEILKKKIIENFNNNLSVLKQNKVYQLKKLKTLIANTQIDFDKKMKKFKMNQEFQLEDNQTKIDNALVDFDKKMKKFKMNQEFQLEDSQTKIDNALVDYDRKTADRLAFLREQASIARKLEIAKNTIEAQTFSAKNGMVANIKTDTPFYLRGYEAIEKEIELIQSRNDKQAFVGGLLKLEQEKRSLEQDKTLLRVEKNKAFLDILTQLEKKQREIEQDKTIEQIELAFKSTLLTNNNEFSAATVKVFSTKFKYNDNKKMLFIAIAIGLMVGVFYVLISDELASRGVSRKKTN